MVPGGDIGPEGCNQGGYHCPGRHARVNNRAGVEVGVGLDIMISEGTVWEGTRNWLAITGQKSRHSPKKLEKGAEAKPGMVDRYHSYTRQVLGLSKMRKRICSVSILFLRFVGAVT